MHRIFDLRLPIVQFVTMVFSLDLTIWCIRIFACVSHRTISKTIWENLMCICSLSMHGMYNTVKYKKRCEHKSKTVQWMLLLTPRLVFSLQIQHEQRKLLWWNMFWCNIVDERFKIPAQIQQTLANSRDRTSQHFTISLKIQPGANSIYISLFYTVLPYRFPSSTDTFWFIILVRRMGGWIGDEVSALNHNIPFIYGNYALRFRLTEGKEM